MLLEKGGVKIIILKIKELQKSFKDEQENQTYIVLLIELIAILKRIYQQNKDANVFVMQDSLHESLQLLLLINDNLLQKCVLELLQSIIENEGKTLPFWNNFIIDLLLKIFDTQSDNFEVVRWAASVLTGLLSDSHIVQIFKDLWGLETLVNLFDQLEDEEMKGAFYVCFKLLSEPEFDLQHMMNKIGLIERIVGDLDKALSPYNQIIVLQTLINLAKDDQNALLIQEIGAGNILGQKLLLTQAKNFSVFCENQEEIWDVKL